MNQDYKNINFQNKAANKNNINILQNLKGIPNPNIGYGSTLMSNVSYSSFLSFKNKKVKFVNLNASINQSLINNKSRQEEIKKLEEEDEEKINNKEDINNFNSNNSSNSNSDKSNKTGSSKSSNKIKKGKINGNSSSNLPRKKYFNKFNSAKENITNENTVILTLKIKVAKNDYRIFNLKKYDDLFISLEKYGMGYIYYKEENPLFINENNIYQMEKVYYIIEEIKLDEAKEIYERIYKSDVIYKKEKL